MSRKRFKLPDLKLWTEVTDNEELYREVKNFIKWRRKRR